MCQSVISCVLMCPAQALFPQDCKPPAPWMTPEIIKSKRCHRYLERIWCKSRSSLDRSRYTGNVTDKCGEKNHFKNKIGLIHSAFTGHTPNIVNADSPQLNPQLASFEPATTAEVRKIII